MLRALVVVCALAAFPALAQDVPEQPNAVTAVQERAYRMMHELDLSVGVLPLDPFSKGLFA